MKKANSIIAGAAAIVAITAVIGISIASSIASEDITKENPKGKKLSAEMIARKEAFKANHEAVVKAVEAGDYKGWLEVVGDTCPFKDKINADNFYKLQELYTVKADIARIMEELGVEKEGFHKGKGDYKGEGCPFKAEGGCQKGKGEYKGEYKGEGCLFAGKEGGCQKAKEGGCQRLQK